jgi:hypothetical protein
METTDRQDPYELVFGAESMDDRLFPPIAEEAEARGQPLDDPDRFLFLSSVGRLLQAIAGAGPQGGAAEESQAADTDALKQYGRLLFHAFHYWRAHKPLHTLDEETVRWLLDEVTSVGDWSLTTPSSSGYLRLPRNLLWASPAANLQPEPADGLFWTLVEPPDEPASLHVLLALGVRPDRAGFSVVPATGVLDDESHWAQLHARPDGSDFETTLPGGELDRLYSVATPAELLKLASLCFWELDPASG